MKKYHLPALQKKYQTKKLKNAYEIWSAKDEETLQILARSGTSISEIARQLGRSEGAIRSALKGL